MKKNRKGLSKRVAYLEDVFGYLDYRIARLDSDRWEKEQLAQRSADAFKQRFDELNAMRAECV